MQNELHVTSLVVKQQACEVTKGSVEIKGRYSELETFTSATVLNWLGLLCSRT